MALLKRLIDKDGVIIYPQTATSAVLNSENKNLDEIHQDIYNQIGNIELLLAKLNEGEGVIV